MDNPFPDWMGFENILRQARAQHPELNDLPENVRFFLYKTACLLYYGHLNLMTLHRAMMALRRLGHSFITLAILTFTCSFPKTVDSHWIYRHACSTVEEASRITTHWNI